jgi:transcription antitermination factor NusG
MLYPADDATPRWCVIRTKPRWEARVAERLQSENVSAYAPVMRRVEAAVSSAGAKLRYEKPQCLFPGYMFVNLAPRDCLQIMQWQPGVRAVMRVLGSVAALSQEQMDEIRHRENAEGFIPVTAPPLVKGQKVCIVEGVFEGLEGLFERYVHGQDRVRILLQLLSGGMPLELDRRLVAPSGF